MVGDSDSGFSSDPSPPMVYRIDIEITTPLKPTEVEDRVIEAIHALFPGATVEKRGDHLVASAHSLDRLVERLHEQEIVDTAREVFLQSLHGNEFTFDLKKQAAHEGVVNFAVGSPAELGDLHVRVRVEEPDPEAFIHEIVPATPVEDDREPES